MSKIFHRELALEVEALLEPIAAPMTRDAAPLRAWLVAERGRVAALHAAGFSVVWSVEQAQQLARLGARLARVIPRENDETWPEQRACWPDGFARYALAVDIQTWGSLRTVLDFGLEGAKQRAEMLQILVTRGGNRETLDALETIARLGGRAAAISYLEGDL